VSGAHPSPIDPTAAGVGAHPSPIDPTAAGVGAHPSPIDPTAAGVGRSGSRSPRSGHPGPYLVPILGVGSPVPVSGQIDDRIASIAELQRGRAARHQLLAAGISRSAIGRRLAAGRLIRVRSAVFAVRPVLAVPLAAETEALLACGRNVLLSHSSAAALWGIGGTSDGLVEVTVPRRRHLHAHGILAHRTRSILPRDVRVEQGLPVTSPARTLLDRAAVLTPFELEREVDEALSVRRIVTREEILDVVDRGAGRRGAASLRRLLGRRTGEAVTQSEAERLFLRLVREAGLPEPATQVRLAGYRVDFLWREQRVVFEIDGYRFHTSRRAFDRDRRKDLALKQARYDPNRVSRDQVKYEGLSVLAHVAAALARAAR
jgi:very-short-patch-repair endonuclease